MEPSTSFNELIVWQKAHQFTLRTYALTRAFPRDEIYGLTSQFRRAAVSIAANIAEGYSRKGNRDKLRFFNYAQTSLQECNYYLLLARELKYPSDSSINALADEVGRLLFAYSRAIERRLPV